MQGIDTDQIALADTGLANQNRLCSSPSEEERLSENRPATPGNRQVQAAGVLAGLPLTSLQLKQESETQVTGFGCFVVYGCWPAYAYDLGAPIVTVVGNNRLTQECQIQAD